MNLAFSRLMITKKHSVSRFALAISGVCVALVGLASVGLAQPKAGASKTVFDYVTFYESPGLRGASFSVESAGEIRNLRSKDLKFFSGLSGFSSGTKVSWDNVISSVGFNGAFRVTLYRERDLEGPSVSFTTTQRTLPASRGVVFDNQVSSIAWEPLVEGEGQPRVIFYNRENYTGDSFFIYPGEDISKLEKKRRTSRSKDWDDEIRSMRVIGDDVRVTLYADKSFKGKRVTIRADAESLLPIGFAAVASSVKVSGSNREF